MKGIIYDYKKEPINRVLIQIYDKDTINLIRYQFSNSLGEYKIQNINTGNYLIKVSAFNYQTIYNNLNIEKQLSSIDFQLNLASDYNLKEVIVISYPKIAILKGDTISYNLSSIRDSTDSDLGDLIKKLPGLELTKDGKVKFQGVSIDKILVDGNDFFGNKQQIATENISSDMVEGIDLLLKNQDNLNLKDFDENTKIALNIKLNAKSKNKILGNIEANGGVSSKYLFHSNFFNFFKNGNLSLISDYNNIGKTPLTVADYIDMIGGLNASSSSGLSSINDLIPQYIYSENRLKSKINLFSALNFTFNENNLKINSNIFFNNFKQSAFKKIEKYFLNAQPIKLNEVYSSKSQNLLINPLLKVGYYLNSKSSLSYNFIYSPSKGNSVEDIDNGINYKNLSKANGSSVFNDLAYNLKVNSNLLFQSNLNFSLKNNKSDLNLTTSDISLFNYNSNKIIQNFYLKNKELKFLTSILYKKGHNKYKFSSELDFKKESLVTEIKNFNQLNDLNQIISNFKNSIVIKQYLIQKIYLNLTTLINNFTIEKTRRSKSVLENNLSFNYLLNTTNNFSLGFSNKYSINDLNMMLTNSYIVDFQTLSIPPNFKEVIFRNTKTLSFSFNNFNSKNQQFVTFNLNYSFSDKNFSTNSSYNNNFNSFNYVISNQYKDLQAIVIFDRKLEILPVTLKSSLTINYNSYENKISDDINLNKLTNRILEINILSNLKKSKFQFQLFYSLNKSTFKETLSRSNFKYSTENFGLNTSFKMNLFKVKMNFDYLNQNNGLNKNQFFLFSPDVSVESKKKKWTYNLKGNNLLNLNRFEYLNQNNNSFLIERSFESVIPGYFLLGVKFNL